MPTADLTDGRGHQQRGQCFALRKSNSADEGPVSAHCHGLSDEWGWKGRMVWADQPYYVLVQVCLGGVGPQFTVPEAVWISPGYSAEELPRVASLSEVGQ